MMKKKVLAAEHLLVLFVFSQVSTSFSRLPRSWMFSYCGQTFKNVHQSRFSTDHTLIRIINLDSDYVKDWCDEGRVCVPFPHCTKFCDKLDFLSINRQVTMIYMKLMMIIMMMMMMMMLDEESLQRSSVRVCV